MKVCCENWHIFCVVYVSVCVLWTIRLIQSRYVVKTPQIQENFMVKGVNDMKHD